MDLLAGWLAAEFGFEKKDNTTKLRVWINKSSEGLEIVATINRV